MLCDPRGKLQCMRSSYVLSGIALLAMVGLGVYGYTYRAHILVLNPQGPIALEERSIIGITLLYCSIVVIPVFVMLFWFVWKYHTKRPNVHVGHRPDWDHENVWAEFIWWAVPSVIIVFLSIIAWQSSHGLDPYKQIENGKTSITVEVVALNWKWLFIYPTLGIASVNMVEFPVDTPVHFVLTADAPMNSFWIPQLGGQIMVMPGMSSQLNLLASAEGTFAGSSANISGKGFAGMRFTAKSVSEAEFMSWVEKVHQLQNPLSKPEYDALALPSEYNAVALYSPVTSPIYEDVLARYMQPQGTMTP